MARRPTDTAIFSLRIREDLRKRIEREAQRQERSMNTEIIERLEESFNREERRDIFAEMDKLRSDVNESGRYFRNRSNDLLRELFELLSRMAGDEPEKEETLRRLKERIARNETEDEAQVFSVRPKGESK